MQDRGTSKVRLVPKSKKGKDRVSAFGEIWTQKDFAEHVLFKTDAKGPWIFVISDKGEDRRWVSLCGNDPNFTVEEI